MLFLIPMFLAAICFATACHVGWKALKCWMAAD